jgi:hypothetical protein
MSAFHPFLPPASCHFRPIADIGTAAQSRRTGRPALHLLSDVDRNAAWALARHHLSHMILGGHARPAHQHSDDRNSRGRRVDGALALFFHRLDGDSELQPQPVSYLEQLH